MLVVWGQFAQSIGLVHEIELISLHQKKVEHDPQTKVLEFLMAILAGLKYLQELSRSADPIDQDQAVAKAWLRPGLADYSGVSRTLARLNQAEAQQIAAVLDKITGPILAEEVMQALQHSSRLVYDGDLTARPVSNTSTSYPGVAYGHMSAGLQLGYQAAMVSMHSPTYGRIWLSVVPHPGDTVSCSEAEAMLRAAEAKTGYRPLRRTDLLCGRIRSMETICQEHQAQIQESQEASADTRARLAGLQEQLNSQQIRLTQLEAQYHERQRCERPYSALAKARQRLNLLKGKLGRAEKRLATLAQHLINDQEQLCLLQQDVQRLRSRLDQCKEDNRTNFYPIQATFRLDAGFGTRENVAFLIEMGYEAYTKPYSDWLTPRLKREADQYNSWTRVGGNAEMIAWKARQFTDFPYPLDVALERFYTGQTLRFGTLIHFGTDTVTTDLPGWFHCYNGRQLIEAGIKEGKNVFGMHHLKVRSAPAIFLQEQLAVFAANFVRWAARWLTDQCPQLPRGWQNTAELNVKEQVTVAAHTSAWVDWQDQGCLLMFTDQSLFAGRSLHVNRQWTVQLPLPFSKNVVF